MLGSTNRAYKREYNRGHTKRSEDYLRNICDLVITCSILEESDGGHPTLRWLSHYWTRRDAFLPNIASRSARRNVQFDASSYFVPKGSGTSAVVWQVCGLRYLGVKQFNGKKGPFVEAQALFQFWRIKPDGSLVPLSGVCDANTMPGKTFRLVLEALGVGGMDTKSKIPADMIRRFCDDMDIKLREERPAIKMDYTLGHGFIKVSKAEHTEFTRDCHFTDLSALSVAIVERHLGDARRVLLDGEQEQEDTDHNDTRGVRQSQNGGEGGEQDGFVLGSSASIQRAVDDIVDGLLREGGE